MAHRVHEKAFSVPEIDITIDFNDPIVRKKIRILRERLRAKSISKEPCPFFQRGDCTLGSMCKFSHNILIATFKPPPCNGVTCSPRRYHKLKSSVPCELYLKGECRLGSHCSNAHPLNAPDISSSSNEIC
ncbi:hypothetical protein K502DRAFT_347994 [Neoconidiobolus thromboides FSU 785]|nr:hypothetical protein K502DRAFT_347994 [Neoconidiobolus thromboides FSU 785]